MSATLEFYRARADECATGARDANLDNVRDRFLRAEAAWRQLADRLIQTEHDREANLKSKAAAVA